MRWKLKPLERSRFRSIERVAGCARAPSTQTFGRKPSLCIESLLVKFWRNKERREREQTGRHAVAEQLPRKRAKTTPRTLRALPQKHARQEAREERPTRLQRTAARKISKCVLVFRKQHNLFASSGRKSEWKIERNVRRIYTKETQCGMWPRSQFLEVNKASARLDAPRPRSALEQETRSRLARCSKQR